MLVLKAASDSLFRISSERLFHSISCIINISVILGRRNLFEMGAVPSARDQWRSQPDIW